MQPLFTPISIGALYPGIERGLAADILATRALGGTTYTVCTSHIVAGHGKVTDVLEVPSDTVSSQLEHVFATTRPTGAKVGVAGSRASVASAFRMLGLHLQGPLVLDMTLSGPSGEDLADGGVREALTERFPLADVVSLRKNDAQLAVGMQIDTLDDAQVAVQRLHKQGARSVLLRMSKLQAQDGGVFSTDLLYDGDDFALYEAPSIETKTDLYGASSALHLALLQGLARDQPVFDAMQTAKAFVTDAIRRHDASRLPGALAYFAPSSPAHFNT